MVLGGRQGEDRPPVRNGQHTDLLTMQPLLDQQLVTSAAEFPLSGDAFDGVDRLAAIAADDGSLASRQTVGFDHDRHNLLGVRVASFDKADRGSASWKT